MSGDGERAALRAGIGAAAGTGVGAAFMVPLGAVAVFAVLGAVIGMGTAYLLRDGS